MKTENLERFKTVMAALAATFGAEVSEAQLTGYWWALDDLPMEATERAARNAMRQCKFMPKAVELRELAGDMSNNARAVHAWGAFVAAIARHGTYSSVDFDDPIINAVVRNLGGWQKLCNTESDELEKWTRKDFERIYVALCVSGVAEEQTRYLVGSHEQNNAAKGHEISAPAVVTTGLPPHREGVVRRLSAPERLALSGHAGSGQRVAEIINSVMVAKDGVA